MESRLTLALGLINFISCLLKLSANANISLHCINHKKLYYIIRSLYNTRRNCSKASWSSIAMSRAWQASWVECDQTPLCLAHGICALHTSEPMSTSFHRSTEAWNHRFACTMDFCHLCGFWTSHRCALTPVTTFIMTKGISINLWFQKLKWQINDNSFTSYWQQHCVS